MIEGAIFPNSRLRMHDNATEVMNAQPFPDPSLRWKRDARRNLGETLNQESERLYWNMVLVTPAKDTVDEQRLESLGEQPSHHRTQSWSLLPEASNIGT